MHVLKHDIEISIALFIYKGDGLTIVWITIIVSYMKNFIDSSDLLTIVSVTLIVSYMKNFIQVINFAWFNKIRVSRDTYRQDKIRISVLQSIEYTFSGFSFVVSHV